MKYLGPTNHKGSRWKASCAARSLTLSQDYEVNGTENATLAARALVEKMGWHGHYQGGQDHKGDYQFVRLDECFQQGRVTCNDYKAGFFYVAKPERA